MWLRPAVLAVALVASALPAFARSGVSDARRWRVLLPTVRATTDCIAQAINASPAALTYARQENWLEAVKSMPQDCAAVGSRLVAEHDRLYGPGTGKAFVEGPYASDLPRALKVRLKPDIGTQAAQPTEERPTPTAGETVGTAPAVLSLRPSEPLDEHELTRAQTEVAQGENAAVAAQSAAEIAALTPPSTAAAPSVTRSPDEAHFDRPARPSPVFGVAYVAMLAAAGLFGLRWARGWNIRGLTNS